MTTLSGKSFKISHLAAKFGDVNPSILSRHHNGIDKKNFLQNGQFEVTYFYSQCERMW